MSRVEVWRGPAVESVHRVSVAVVDAAGRLRASSGTVDMAVFARSAVKPIQALPVVEDGAADHYGFGDREIALCCASHSGEPRHVEGVRRMLRKIGAEESALACGAHAPFHGPSARALEESGTAPGKVHNNCSGKHAGMIALACKNGWAPAGYHVASHPVQKRMLDEISQWAGVPTDDVQIAVDGCGVLTFGLALERLAHAFAKLAGAARAGEGAPARVIGAMSRFPDHVAGTDRLCTVLMKTVDGRIIAKTGAEGVYCAAVPGAELGIALKAEDGANRASEPALIGVLKALGLISDDEIGELSRFAEPEVRNTRGETVGRIRAVIDLSPHGMGKN